MKKLTSKEFCDIMEGIVGKGWKGDNIFKGLLIIAKYISPEKNQLIQGVEYEIICSVDIDELINAGITEDDVVELRNLNWMIEEDYLACYV